MRKNQLTVAIASLLLASMGGVAFAQTTPQTTPQTPPPQSQQYTNGSQSNQSSTSSWQTKQKIKQALTSHGVTATNVNVAFNNGTATLSGTVFARADINKAKQAAKSVQGVKHVNTSNLHVRQQSAHHTAVAYTSGSQSTMGNDNASNNSMTSHNNTSSSRIRQKIKQALTSHGVTATNVNIMFSNGTATLSGTVATQSDINKAKQAANSVQGVKHVNATNLRVQSTAQ